MDAFLSYPKYFNHASVFPYQEIVRDAVDYALDRQKNNEKRLFDFITQEKEILIQKLRSFLNVAENPICFGLSVSQFMSHLVWGYPFQEGDSVMIFRDDYPSLTLPWQLLLNKGVQVHFLDTDSVVKDLTVFEEALAKHKPKFFACSAVHNVKGIYWPLKQMSHLCKRYDVYFVVDATQTVGVLDIDWDDIAADALLVSTYKWLMWPMGLGIMSLSEKMLSVLRPATAGARSISKQFSQSDPTLLWADKAQAFESGALNLLTLSAAHYLLDLYSQIGMDLIQRRTMNLASRLRKGLQAKGYCLYPDNPDFQWSHLVTVDTNAHPDLFEYLNQNDYIVVQREGWLRLSPAFYQNETDVQALLNSL